MTTGIDKRSGAAWPLLGTAFFEGACVLVIEIAGARALGAFYGASLRVWTAQITATLLFLALGYGLGGRLAKRSGPLALPGVFWVAGLWLVLFPFWRATALRVSASAGVEGGALLASAFLFGLPLLCLGAVSPLLIARFSARGQDPAEAAGSVFFTNTLGGLAGGWVCALLIVPHVPLRLGIVGTGLSLALLGAAWAWGQRKVAGAAVAVVALGLALAGPSRADHMQRGGMMRVLRTQATGSGLLQVVDLNGEGLALMVDGVTQGGIDRATGASLYEFTDYQDLVAWHYHPQAKEAVLLGLGSGALASKLDKRGVHVTAVELEPAMAAAARDFFRLPASVKVVEGDARAWLRRAPSASADLVFLDTFAGEVVPWHLTTREAFAEMRRVLKPDGHLIINTVSSSIGGPGLDRLKATVATSFPKSRLWMEEGDDESILINATLLAGEQLQMSQAAFPGVLMAHTRPKIVRYLTLGHDVTQATGQVMTDELSDADQADAKLRLEWRRRVLVSLGPELLGD